MHRVNEQGKIGTVLLTLLFAATILILIAAVVLSQRKDTVVLNSSPDAMNNSEASEIGMAEVPDNWQEYTNEANDYTLNYPASWGTVLQTEPSADTYEYRFTTREEVVLKQAPNSEDGIEFTGDYSIFNQFEEIRNNLLFCSNGECDKSHSLPIEQVRLFSNKNSNDVAEVFVQDEQALDMVALINTGFNSYPGLNMIVRVDDEVEGNSIVEKRMNANEEKFDFFIELRDFLEYVR